ncbi:MAG: DNA glycosylase AlkZ-like family protein, partial [Myxococcales bacterium]
ALPAALAEAGLLKVAQVGGFNEPFYFDPAHEGLLARAASDALRPALTTVLSPFDPLVWDRTRALELFGFDYRLECYTPAPKRRYGYFVLPLLHRGALVGRLDAKAHRREGRFEVKALFFEPGVVRTDALLEDVAQALLECARWHGTPGVELARAEPRGWLSALRRVLKGRGG